MNSDRKRVFAKKKTIAIDFDGVIHQYSEGFKDGTIYDPPMKGALQAIKDLLEDYNVVIFTARKQDKEIKEWLNEYWQEEFDEEAPALEITNVKKPSLSIFIDDRAIEFKSWNSMVDKVKDKLSVTKE
ncbi:MAG: hypothetical protein WC783_02670 [Candidatus Paceibacterota bacterium]